MSLVSSARLLASDTHVSYSCKYTPIELLAAFGLVPHLIDDEAGDFTCAECATHANLCSHAKALIESAQGADGVDGADALVIMDCCDSMRRVFDVLDAADDSGFLAFMDLPHDDGRCARERFARQLETFAQTLEEATDAGFSRERFLAACANGGLGAHDAAVLETVQGPFYAVVGARMSTPLLELVRESLGYPVVNLTCSGNRALPALPDDADTLDFEALMAWYAQALLTMTPCMRMAEVAGRRSLTEHPGLVGIVYNTVKFCDFYGFDYLRLQEETVVPILKIESDYMPTPAGQLATRLEAFRESIERVDVEEAFRKETTPMSSRTTLYAGIDSGSTTTNMVVIDEEGTVLATSIVRTGAKAQNGARAALAEVCAQLDVAPEDFAAIMATGYGRANIPFATATTTEITCHAKGAHHINPDVHTIVDIGGQDSKVICLDDQGKVSNFVMNDKCAAGTGRFLEAMARTLEMDLPTMAEEGLHWKHALTISSMCTVFAESEVISLIADNHSEADIIHGLNESIAARTSAMVARTKGQSPYMMTGGVARNKGVVMALEGKLGSSLFVAENPDLCGALGAALIARDKAQ